MAQHVSRKPTQQPTGGLWGAMRCPVSRHSSSILFVDLGANRRMWSGAVEFPVVANSGKPLSTFNNFWELNEQ